jgi:prolyl-tRNA editing enzyme YbaK/EbsC (Cys-tRNA(Pro) deacylase)
MSTSSSAQRVQQALNALGLDLRVVELPASTRSAIEAAQAIGCQVGQIAKSLVFRGQSSDRPILIVASGANRVNERRVAEAVGEPLGKADADYVRQRTGYAIGGVPPIGHTEPLLTLVDEDLLVYDEIWAAAGTPHAVFRLTPADLLRMTKGQALAIT